MESVLISGSVPISSIGATGLVRTRVISVAHATLPVLATSGVATFTSPGVRGIVVHSVKVTAGTIALTGNINPVIRYAIDSANDAAAALLLPTTPPSASATADLGQIGSISLMPSIVPDTEAGTDLRVVWLTLPIPIEIPLTDPILRIDFAHNIGTGVTIELMLSALEAV